MFGFLRNIVRKREENSAPASPSGTPAYAQGNPVYSAKPIQPKAATASPAVKGIEIPLATILADLPLELHPKVRGVDVGNRVFSIGLDKVLAQLSRGSVKIPFSELRHSAPDVFLPDIDRDKVMINLPLGEILARLNPALIARRRAQRTVEVPEDISSPFDLQHDSLIFSVGTPKSPAQPATPKLPSATPAPAAQPAFTAPPPSAPGRFSLKSTPTPPAPSAEPISKPAPAMASAVRSLSMFPSQPLVQPEALAPAPLSFPVTNIPGKSLSVLPPAQTADATPAPAPLPEPAAPTPVTAVKPPAPLEAPAPVAAPIVLGLAALAEGWNENVRKEIVFGNMVDCSVALPVSAVDQGLRHGRLSFPWKIVRGWLTPAVQLQTSPQDEIILDLPLKIVAPLFLERQKEAAKSQQKVAIDEDIPNLFFGFPQNSSAPVTPSTNASDTNYYVWGDTSDRAMVDESAEKKSSPGTKFVAKYATPNEIVSRASSLEGVAGALIALPDGLMVASKISTDLNGDTLAAFLPQIFGKVSQCTRELRMGDLNNLNFTVGNIPWKIFRVNAIFFAAFGRTGQALPTAQLAALASELDHKPK
jgi:predicted regulator of Ras-like GTPase activity (Roadblock/LC7/MglB family)